MSTEIDAGQVQRIEVQGSDEEGGLTPSRRERGNGERPVRFVHAVGSVGHHDLDDGFGREQASECMAGRIGEPSLLAFMDRGERLVGAAPDESGLVDRIRPQPLEMEHGMSTTWNILRVKSPFETTVAGQCLVGLRLKAYIPVETRRIALRKRVIERVRCLVPGYVFIGARGDMPWADVLDVRHVIRPFREPDGRLAVVTDSEVATIRLMEREHNKRLFERPSLQVGDIVRPTRGAFQSIEVLLRSVRGSTATIEVHMLGSTREAKVSVSDLEKVA